MRYRTHKKTGDKISELGFGACCISGLDERAGAKLLEKAYKEGVNYYDMAAADARCFPYYGEALSGVRKDVFYQIHFGADYDDGIYGWTTDPDKIRHNIDKVLKCLKTDYIDYGFIHCMDEVKDWERYQRNGSLDFLLGLKEQNIVRHLGLSSHTPAAIQKILDDVPADTLMFSVNPGYDRQRGDYAQGRPDERLAIYSRCEKEGIGMTVMKPFSGGQLLDASLSPFGKALTPYQCIQYELDCPAVLSVLPGIGTAKQLDELLGFFQASEKERDYSVIDSFRLADLAGKCVYCNHCLPCPAGIDVGLVNKYYDLAKNGDVLAGHHYRNLSADADDCISCGRCTERCPFGTDQMNRMKEIAGYFAGSSH